MNTNNMDAIDLLECLIQDYGILLIILQRQKCVLPEPISLSTNSLLSCICPASLCFLDPLRLSIHLHKYSISLSESFFSNHPRAGGRITFKSSLLKKLHRALSHAQCALCPSCRT